MCPETILLINVDTDESTPNKFVAMVCSAFGKISICVSPLNESLQMLLQSIIMNSSLLDTTMSLGIFESVSLKVNGSIIFIADYASGVSMTLIKPASI